WCVYADFGNSSRPRFADSPGDRVLSPAARAHVVVCASPPVRGLTGGYGSVARCAGSRRLYVPTPGSRTHRGIEFCRPLRGLTSFVCASPPVRGLTGGYGSVARCAGSRRLYVPPPGSRTHRGIEFCRPLRGLTSFVCASPPVRGLTGGYGSVARCAGSRRLYVPLPRFADSPGDRVLSPAARAH